MKKKEPKFIVIEEHRHFRMENDLDDWIVVELFEHASKFLALHTLAPGAALEFVSSAGGEIDCRWWKGRDMKSKRLEEKVVH